MGFSSGTFTFTSNSFNTPVTGTTISSTAAQATWTELATALSTCVLKDGTQTLTGNIPFANFKITGLGAGSALTDSANLQQVQYGFGSFLTSVAGTNTITATATPTPAYTVGQRFTFVPANTNTGATTLNISSVGAGAVQLAGAALTGGEIVANVPVTVYVSAATPVFEIITPTQFPDSRALVVGATDSTKKIRFEADSITTGTTRVVTCPDRSFTMGQVITLGTEQASTSGTAITFTGIPSGVKRVTVNLFGVSTNGTANLLVQLGDAGGIETSGYVSRVEDNAGGAASTAGFIITINHAATSVWYGSLILNLQDSSDFSWCGVSNMGDASNAAQAAGGKSLSAELTQVSLTTTNGTDAFDLGSVNISYEF